MTDIACCPTCGYPVRYVHPPEYRIRLKPWAELDAETRAVFRSAERAKAAVAKWPAWKANECRCPASAAVPPLSPP